MISRDFILRQVHQLTQALAVVLFHKRSGRPDEAQAALAEALAGATELELETLRQTDRQALLALCAPEGTLLSDKAVAVADLLREDDSAAGRERALWLYEAALDADGAVPFDIYERIASLQASLER